MALETDFNQSPYFDDYKDVAEGKDYHRVLFKPGLAVQTRELTQLQSIMQEQVARFGDNIFVEGTIIDGCAFQYDANVAFVKLQDRDIGGNTVTVSVFANGIVTGLTSGVRAKVITTVAGSQVSFPDTNTLMVKYLNGGTSTTAKTFSLNETISYLPADGGAGQYANTLATSTSGNPTFGFGSIFSVGEGIVYGKGHFVNVRPQSIVLEKFSTKPSYKVGFKILESIVDSDTDQTLLDNARGSYNYTAPGADRLKLNAILDKKVLGTANTESFTPIFEVDAGNIRTVKQRTVYDELGKTMAERTFDESGNYEIKKMQIAVKEHLDNGSNFGRYSNTNPIANTSRLAVGVEPGEAYVMGYHNEHLSTVWIDTDKGIDSVTETGLTVTASYSNYIEATDVVGPWDPTTFETIDLYNATHNNYDTGAMGNGAPGGSKIGTAKLKFVEYVSGTAGQSSGRFRFYLFDVQMTAGSFADVRSLYQLDGTGPESHANVVLTGGNAVLTEPSFNRSVFQTGLYAVKEVGTATYSYRAKDSLSFSGAGTATLTMSGPHAGGTEELDYGAGTLTNALKQTIQVVNTSNASVTFAGNPTWATAGSNNITADGGGDNFAGLQVGDFVLVSNGTSSSTLLKVANVDSSSVIKVSPAPGIVDGNGQGVLQRIYPTGHIFDLTRTGSTGGARSANVASATSMAIDLGETFDSGFQTTIFYNAQRELAQPAQKLVRKNRFVKLDLATATNGSDGPWPLGFADVFNIRNVYVGTTYSTTNRNATSDFKLNVNSTDSLYKISELEKKPTSKLNLVDAKLLVELDYFEHDRSNGIGFFTKDSYPIDGQESTSNPAAIATPQIPVFSSTVSDQSFDLRDSVDFRPRENSTATDTTTVATATINPTEAVALDIDSDGTYVPIPNQNWEADVEYYLGRVDRVVIGKDGKKRIVRGISSAQAIPPQQPAESMSLGLVFIPPYPSLSQENARRFNRAADAVSVKPIYNRRYTMRDINALDERISNLEYYSSLNVLEKSAKDLQIPDDNGINRFKNGIFVDSFFNHLLADTTNLAYSCSVDVQQGELRPRFESFNIDLAIQGSTPNLTRKGKHVRLDITGASGTFNVNDQLSIGSPASATGTLRDFVQTDTGYRLYLHNVTGTFVTSEVINNATSTGTGTISTVQSATTSDALMLTYSHNEYVSQPWATNLVNPIAELQFEWVGELTLTPEADHWNDVTTLPEVTFDIDIATPFEDLADAIGTTWGDWNRTTRIDIDRSTQVDRAWTWWGRRTTTTTTTNTTRTDTATRDGFRIGVDPFERTQSTGPFVSDVGTVPFIRSREVQFSATGMRPQTTVYPFFEDIDVSEYVTNSSGVRGGSLVTDSNGSVTGTLLIPNNDSIKFRVGERVFKLIDIQDLIVEAGNATTSATAKYNATGLTVSQKGISLSTREPVITRIPETEVITNVTRTSRVDRSVRFSDPVAQTFQVGSFEYTNPATKDNENTSFGIGADGVFVTGIDLYFERKPDNNGVAVEIREVDSGQITTIRVPFGYKHINASDVNVSSDGSSVTPFYFDAPVYLRGGREYCFIVKPDGNDPGYRLWTARLGGTDVASGAIVDQQPAVGMMFTSANDRTYSPRQNEDVKFSIWRASFTTGVDGTVTLVNQDDEYLKTTQTSGRYEIGEAVVGEANIKLSANTALPVVGDTVSFGSNTGVVRQVKSNTAGAFLFSADIKGSFSTSNVITFRRPTTSGTLTYTGTVSAFGANSISGTVQFHNPATGELVIDSSAGGITGNTTADNGFIRGLTSNTTAQVFFNRNYKYNVVSPKLSIAQYVDTNVNVSIKPTTNAYSVASTYTPISWDRDHTFYDNEKMVSGKTLEDTNSVALGGSKTLSLKATMSTNNDRLSPIFDLGRAKSLILVHNLINNTADKEFGNQGLATTKYITKKIVLQDGQDAEDVRVILDAYRPSGTDVKVYARIQNEYDGDDFSQKHYTILTPTTTQKRDSSIEDKTDFVEVEYNFGTAGSNTTALTAYSNTDNSSIVEYRDSNNITFSSYKYVSIKIVLTSSGSHLVPRVKNLRAIALQR